MSAKSETAKLFKDGLAVRRAVLGPDYVDGSIAKASPPNGAGATPGPVTV
jgi:hypothetical protein